MIIVPAIYHDNIRAVLLAEGPQGTYGKSRQIDNVWFRKAHFTLDVPRKQGKEANDVTSFHPAYKTNGQDQKPATRSCLDISRMGIRYPHILRRLGCTEAE